MFLPSLRFNSARHGRHTTSVSSAAPPPRSVRSKTGTTSASLNFCRPWHLVAISYLTSGLLAMAASLPCLPTVFWPLAHGSTCRVSSCQ